MNKRLLYLAVILIFLACVDKDNSSVNSSTPQKEVKIISAKELHDNYLDDDSYVIIDNRPKQLYQMGHIKRAVSMTYKSDGSFENILSKEKLSKAIQNKKVILYCNGFVRAYNAVQDATQKWSIPVDKLIWFKGGMTEWLNSGYPIER